MSLIARNEKRSLVRLVCRMAAVCGLLGTVGCVSGQRPPFVGTGPTNTPFAQPPARTYRPVIVPRTVPSQENQSGPVLLPRESFRQAPENSSPTPIITPRTQPSPLASPSIDRSTPPAILGDTIEIIPNMFPAESTGSQKLFEIVPAEPAVRLSDEVERLLSSPRSGYEELPPPPE